MRWPRVFASPGVWRTDPGLTATRHARPVRPLLWICVRNFTFNSSVPTKIDSFFTGLKPLTNFQKVNFFRQTFKSSTFQRE